ncbi:MAG: LptF/LptG family permease [Endomicrobium sp.]|jgi:lipopolysaccharide export LptBFGC system permease protein LptF|nr:LptF/LptG family permease [Endomicrobium sp.]
MVKKLYLYIIKEFLHSFIFGVLVFSFLLILNVVFEMMDLLIARGIAIWIVIKIFIFYLPNVLTLSIPMAILFGTLLSYGRLSADNEITAIRAAGFGYKTLTFPIIIFVCGISFFLIFFNHFWAPKLNASLKAYSQEVIMKKPLTKFNEKALTKVNNYNIYSNKVDNIKNTLMGVSIYKFEDGYVENDKKKSVLPQNDNGEWRISASSATVKTYATGAMLTLYKGYWQKASTADITNITQTTFKKYSLFIPLKDKIQGFSIRPSEMPTLKLLELIKQYKEQKIDFMPYLLDYWLRWIYTTAPIVFILIALPIGIRTSKGGKAIGSVVSLGIVLVYYTLLATAMALGEKNYMPMGIILWLPNFVIGTIGVCLFIKMVKK